MAIALDNTASNHTGAGATNTFALTVGSGSNRFLVVGFSFNKASLPSITSVTYAGVAMTPSANNPKSPTGNNTVAVALFYLKNPASGSNNVVITLSASADEINALASSYTGVKDVPQDFFTQGASGTTATLNTTTTVDNSWLVGIFRNDNDGDGSAGSGTTLRTFINGQCGMYDTNGAKSPVGSYSLLCTFGSAAYSGIGFSMAPAEGIAVDASGGTTKGASTSHTQAFTVGSGSNRKLFVIIETQSVGDVVTGVTYAGVAMTQAVKRVAQFSSSFYEYIYYLDNPASGSNNIVVSCSSSVAIALAYAAYTGCAAGIDSTASSSAASGSTFSQAFTTVANNAWTLNWIRVDAGGSNPVPGVNATTRVAGATIGDVGLELFDSGWNVSPAGSYTMNYADGGVNTTWTSIGVSFAPVGAAVTTTPDLRTFFI